MNEKNIAKSLSAIIPDRPGAPGISGPNTLELVAKEAASIKEKKDAREIARIKYREKRKLRELEAKQEKRREQHEELAKELGLEVIPDDQTPSEARRIAEQKERVKAIETIEAQAVEPLDVREVAKGSKVGSTALKSALALQGTSRPEITKLLTALNINLSVQLTKQDTANLLACLLTCNEMQLQALMSNKKVPVAIKTVIRRLIDDSRQGDISTIEKLWDRVFGKGPMQLDLPEDQSLEKGLIPNQPISREAYIIIRDTLMK